MLKIPPLVSVSCTKFQLVQQTRSQRTIIHGNIVPGPSCSHPAYSYNSLPTTTTMVLACPSLWIHPDPRLIRYAEPKFSIALWLCCLFSPNLCSKFSSMWHNLPSAAEFLHLWLSFWRTGYLLNTLGAEFLHRWLEKFLDLWSSDPGWKPTQRARTTSMAIQVVKILKQLLSRTPQCSSHFPSHLGATWSLPPMHPLKS